MGIFLLICTGNPLDSLGRPSRLPSVFINFETDPCLCPHPQKHYFLIPTSPNLWHPTPLGHPFGHPLRHLCLSSTIQPSTIIHLLSHVLLTPLTATSFGPHPSDSTSDVHRMSALWVTCRSELLVTAFVKCIMLNGSNITIIAAMCSTWVILCTLTLL